MTKILGIGLLLFGLAIGGAVQAQQVQATYGTPITLDAAKKAMAAAEAEAKKNGWTMAISILDSGGHLVAMERIDGTQYGSIRLAEAKARTALDYRRPSKVFEDLVAKGGVGLRTLSIPDVIAIQGGLPIVVDGKIIGAIGASGGTAEQDEQVAQAGIAALGK